MAEQLGAKTQKKRKAKSVNYIKIFWILFGVGVLSVFAFFVALDAGFFGKMPSVKDLSYSQNEYASEVYTADGEAIGRYSYRRNRVYSEYSDLPKHLVDALIATEDERFYEHSGIDKIGLIRAVVKMGQDGGGSTITQQLAKNLFPRGVRLSKSQVILRKLKEWVIAVKLERNYTKEEIITMYFNTYDFLYQAVGIRMAAKIYFNKLPEDLNLSESATLVGMCKNPASYNPKRSLKRATHRRNIVFGQMLKNDKIDQETFEKEKAEPIVLNYQKEGHRSGVGTYLREYLRGILTARKPERENYRGWQKQQFIEDSLQWENNPLYGWCKKNTKPNGEPYNIYADGLRIHTTIDSRMQKCAEEAVAEHLSKTLQPLFDKQKKTNRDHPFLGLEKREIKKIMKRAVKSSERYRSMKEAGVLEKDILKSFREKTPMRVFTWKGLRDTLLTPTDSILYYKGILRSGFMAMEPGTGKVKAYVGGIDYSSFMYDMVSSGKRQVGSTFKPFLYALAMQEGLVPCQEVLNVSQTFVLSSGDSWTPKNSGNKRLGESVTLAWGLANSVNNITAWIMKQFTPSAVVRIAKDMGIVSPVDAVPALCLGVSDITVKEMVGAYGTFANKGVYAEPIFVSHITDKNGDIIARFSTNTREVMSEDAAYTITEMLRQVVKKGTGRRLGGRYKITTPLGGKTGTTDNNSDGWFMSVNPDLVTGTWVGGDDRAVHFRETRYGQGANTALPIFALFWQKVKANKELKFSNDYFSAPVGYSIDLSCLKENEEEVLEEFIDNDETEILMEEEKEVEFDI